SQCDVRQELLAPHLALRTELFRRLFEGLEDGRSRFSLRVFRRIEPRCQCPDARFEAWRLLPVAGGWRDAPEIVVEFRQVIESMGEPDEARPERAQVGGFQRERFEKVLDLLNRFAG